MVNGLQLIKLGYDSGSKCELEFYLANVLHQLVNYSLYLAARFDHKYLAILDFKT